MKSTSQPATPEAHGDPKKPVTSRNLEFGFYDLHGAFSSAAC